MGFFSGNSIIRKSYTEIVYHTLYSVTKSAKDFHFYEATTCIEKKIRRNEGFWNAVSIQSSGTRFESKFRELICSIARRSGRSTLNGRENAKKQEFNMPKC